MLFMPYRRATLLIPSGTPKAPNLKHLFILLTDPVARADGVSESLFVPVTSVRPGAYFDSSCVLYPGDHPFIKWQSSVNYSLARIEDAQKLVNGVKQGVFEPKAILSGDIFARVCRGLSISKHTTPKVLQFYERANP